MVVPVLQRRPDGTSRGPVVAAASAVLPLRSPNHQCRRRRLSAALIAGFATVLCASRAAWTASQGLEVGGDATFLVHGGSRDCSGRSFLTAREAAASGKGQGGDTELDDFEKARERIRRIQLGLGPNDPLPPEGSPIADAKLKLADAGDVQAVNVNISAQMPGNESEIAATAAAQLIEGMDALPAAPPSDRLSGSEGAYIETGNESDTADDAFAGFADTVDELKPEEDDPRKTKPNFFQALLEDFGVIRFPGGGEVVNQFGIVILMVAIYTGFIAFVDFASQNALGQVFQDVYKAARQEVADL